MTETTTPRPRRPWRRRLLIAAGLFGLLIVGLVAALPVLLGTGAVRGLVLAEVNRIYAPTVIEVDGLSASWTGPLQLRGVVLRDGDGKAVVSSPTATLDRSLVQLLTMRPDYGTLTLHGATVDIERREDGSIDLADALAPILAGDDEDDEGPETHFTLAIDEGSLTLASPELARPLTAERLDMTLHCVPAPLAWEIDLSNPAAQSLSIDGSYDSESSEAVVTIEGTNWPLAVAEAGLLARADFGGRVGIRMAGDDLALTGDTTLTAVNLSGDALKGDRPRFDRIKAAWDVSTGTDGLSIKQLNVEAPVASLGLDPEPAADGGTRWVGRVDLAGLAALLPNTLKLREGMTLEEGSADLEVVLGPDGEGPRPIRVAATLADLSALEGGRLVAMDAPVALSANVLRLPGDAVRVESAAIESAFLKAEGSGDLDQGIKFDGAIDLGALDAQLRKWVDLGAVQLAGAGRFGGDYARGEGGSTFTARLAIEGRGLRVAGLTSEPIARESGRLDLVVRGPASSPGLPGGWSDLRVEARSEGLEALVDVAPAAESYALKGKVTLPPEADAPPTSVSFDASYATGDDRLDLATLLVEHEYGRLSGAGSIAGLTGARVAALSGTAEPDWQRLSALVAASTEPGAQLTGSGRPFHLNGPLSGGSTSEILAGLDAEVGVDLTEAVAFGLQLGPTPLVVRVAGGQVLVSPIETTLNGGRIDLRPAVSIGDDGLIVAGLEQGSTIENVQINDNVSKRLLAYIAPVLREATEVNGQVSARFDRATVPVAGPGPEQGGPATDVAAQVAFQQVTYGPGPMMQTILGLTGVPPERVPHLTLNQLVDVTVADGRVYQSGIDVAVAQGVDVQFEGSVGLDETLAMRVGVPLSDRMLGGQQVLGQIMNGTRVGLPIGGTLSDPVLDRAALQVGMKQQAGQLINRAAGVGADQLLKLLDDEPPADEAAQGEGEAPASGQPNGLMEDVGRGLLRGLIKPDQR